MESLPERLLALLAASEPTDAAERADGDPTISCMFVDMRPAEFASLIREAAQALQAAPEGGDDYAEWLKRVLR